VHHTVKIIHTQSHFLVQVKCPNLPVGVDWSWCGYPPALSTMVFSSFQAPSPILTSAQSSCFFHFSFFSISTTHLSAKSPEPSVFTCNLQMRSPDSMSMILCYKSSQTCPGGICFCWTSSKIQ